MLSQFQVRNSGTTTELPAQHFQQNTYHHRAIPLDNRPQSPKAIARPTARILLCLDPSTGDSGPFCFARKASVDERSILCRARSLSNWVSRTPGSRTHILPGATAPTPGLVDRPHRLLRAGTGRLAASAQGSTNSSRGSGAGASRATLSGFQQQPSNHNLCRTRRASVARVCGVLPQLATTVSARAVHQPRPAAGRVSNVHNSNQPTSLRSVRPRAGMGHRCQA